MGLDGDLCVLEPQDREVLVDLAFEEINRDIQKRIESKQSFFYLGERVAKELIGAFKISCLDVQDVFYHMQNKYEKELIRAGVIVPNSSYTLRV